jgi:hypothetical protein
MIYDSQQANVQLYLFIISVQKLIVYYNADVELRKCHLDRKLLDRKEDLGLVVLGYIRLG